MTQSSDEAYRQAGVDLKKAAHVVEIAKRLSQKTAHPFLYGGIGGFSGAFEIPGKYQHPVLLSGCDGVGTKLKLATMTGCHNSIGIDLVAMSVNDILSNGGEPLAFLDYFATSGLDPAIFEAVLEGIAEGCKQAGCTLLGGETAEMPGFYPDGEYDLAGFCVGVAEKSRMYPQTERIQEGDILIGLTSSGLHSNGYSLARKIFFEDHTYHPSDHLEGLPAPLGETLLTPTRIYVKPVLSLLEAFPHGIKAMAHITGGGFYENIPRVLPADCSAEIDAGAWPRPAIFTWLKQLGHLSEEALFHTFNCGIGYILIVDRSDSDKIVDMLLQFKDQFDALPVGRIFHTPGRQSVEVRLLESVPND